MKTSTRRILMWLVVPGVFVGLAIGVPWIAPERFAWIPFMLPILIIGAMGLHHGFTLDPRYLAKWAKSHDVTITPNNEMRVRRYLLRGRRIRAVGAVFGYTTFSIVGFYVDLDELPFGWLTATFAGYLLGAAAAEIWAMRPERGSVRTASLAPRQVRDYLPRWPIVAARIFAVVTVAVAVTRPFVPASRTAGRSPAETADAVSIIIWSVGAIALALFVEATARRVVRRPQPLVSDEHVAIDDAIRSTALHGLYGAGLALILGALSRTAQEVGHILAFGSPLRNAFFGVAIAAGVTAVFVWLRLGIDQPWVVRRNRTPDPVAA